MVWKLLWQIPVLTHAAHTHTHTHTHIHTHTHALTHTLQSGVPVYIVDVHRSIYNSKPLNLRDAQALKYTPTSAALRAPHLAPDYLCLRAECQKIRKREMQQTGKLCVCADVTICCSISHCVCDTHCMRHCISLCTYVTLGHSLHVSL